MCCDLRVVPKERVIVFDCAIKICTYPVNLKRQFAVNGYVTKCRFRLRTARGSHGTFTCKNNNRKSLHGLRPNAHMTVACKVSFPIQAGDINGLR